MLSQNAAEGGGAGWIVINTHVNQEHIAIENLARQNFAAYCPMLLKRRSHARRVEQVRRPLFPGYMFADVDPSRDNWRPILSTAGVRSVVRFGQSFGCVGESFISELRACEKDGVIVRPAVQYKIGQKVRLASPFEGVVAVILDLDEKDRLTVLMDLMQRPVRAKVKAAEVTPA
jgi:transcriptional antiterminator RfaH